MLVTVPVFEVLAEPRRRQILDLLRQQDRSVGDLVDVLDVSQPNVSRHLRVLRDAGLVSSRAEGQRRVYRVTAEPLRELDEWVSHYRGLWSHALDQLEAHLDTDAHRGRARGRGRRGR